MIVATALISIVLLTPCYSLPGSPQRRMFVLPLKFISEYQVVGKGVVVALGSYTFETAIPPDGTIVLRLPLHRYRPKIELTLQVAGRWFIELERQEKLYKVVWMDGRRFWVHYTPSVLYCLSSQRFREGVSCYLLSVPLFPTKQTKEGDTTYVFLKEIVIRLYPGNVTKIRKWDLDLGSDYLVTVLTANWIYVKGEEEAVYRLGEELKASIVLRILTTFGKASALEEEILFSISVSPEKGFSDVRYAMAEELYNSVSLNYRRSLGVLREAGFGAEIYDYRLEAMEEFFRLGLEALKEGRAEVASVLLKMALDNYMYLRRDVKRIVLQNYFYTPFIVVILVVFSAIFSKLFLEKQMRIATPLLTVLLAVLFACVNPEIRLFINTCMRFLLSGEAELGFYAKPQERNLITMGGVLLFATGLFIASVPAVLILKSDKLKYSLLLLKRRKARLMLILTTVTVVSSAITLHGAGFYGPLLEERYLGKNDAGLSFVSFVKYRIEKQYVTGTLGVTVKDYSRLDYLSIGEATWLASFSREYNIIAFSQVEASTGPFKGSFSAIALNFLYVARYTEFSRLFRHLDGEEKGVLISERVAEALKVRENSYLTISGVKLKIIGVYSSKDVLDIRDIDRNPLFFDPISNRTLSPDLIVPLSIIGESWKIVKITLIIPRRSLQTLVERILVYATNIHVFQAPRRPDLFIVKGYTYLTRMGLEGDLVERVYRELAEVVTADWYLQSVVILLAAIIIGVNAMASVYERRRDLTVLSCLGANPLDLASEVLVEGIGIGIMGGLSGYLLGRTILYLYTHVHGAPSLYPTIELYYIVTTTFVALVSTMLGYLIPARKAVLRVVPSQLLKRTRGKIASRIGNEIVLEPFIKINRGEVDLFLKFLREYFLEYFTSKERDWGFIPQDLKVFELKKEVKYLEEHYAPEQLREEKIVALVNGSFKGQFISRIVDLTIIFELPYLAKELTPTIKIRSKGLSAISSSDINQLIIDIRKALLLYSSYKQRLVRG